MRIDKKKKKNIRNIEEHNNKGTILITVIIVVAVLSIIAYHLFYITRVEIRKSKVDTVKLRCKLTAETVANILFKQISKDQTPTYDWKYDFWYTKYFQMEYNGVFINVIIEDEDSKININDLIKDDGTENSFTSDILRNLFRIKEIDPDKVDVLTEYYSDLRKDSKFTNSKYSGKFNSLIELFSIKKLEENFSFNTIEDTNSLFNYLTIYGDYKYNINTIDRDVLASLTDVLTDVEVDAILDFQESSGFKKVKDLKLVYELSDEAYQIIDGYLKVKSDILKITITTSIGDFEYRKLYIIDKNYLPVKVLSEFIL